MKRHGKGWLSEEMEQLGVAKRSEGNAKSRLAWEMVRKAEIRHGIASKDTERH